MVYTTTKCPHCGYRTRNRETGIQNVELGQTLACCPMCGKPIIDPIKTEYEFMTEKEQQKWTTKSLANADIWRGVVTLILGLILFVVGIFSKVAGGVVFALLGVGLVAMGIRRFVTVHKAEALNIGEQAIYESLLRTSNTEYVNLLKLAYGENREYNPIVDRDKMIEGLKEYSTPEVHERFEKDFLELLNFIKNQEGEIDAKEAKLTNTFVPGGGALVGAVIGASSAIVDAKQNKDLAKKKECSNEGDEKFGDAEMERQALADNTRFEKDIENNSKLENIEETKNKALQQTEKADNDELGLNNLNKAKLRELKDLYDEGLITEEEYKEKRKAIIDKI